MVFEMTRSFDKVQFKLREHLERLYVPSHGRIPIMMSLDEMEKAVPYDHRRLMKACIAKMRAQSRFQVFTKLELHLIKGARHLKDHIAEH